MREIVARFCEAVCFNSVSDTDALQLFFDETNIAAALDTCDFYF
jgi:hypothetical protein